MYQPRLVISRIPEPTKKLHLQFLALHRQRVIPLRAMGDDPKPRNRNEFQKFRRQTESKCTPWINEGFVREPCGTT